MRISMIIPAYNEEKRFKEFGTLEKYRKFFSVKKKSGEIEDFEILVVLNNCKDNTIGVVKNAEKRFKEIKHLDFTQGGKGFAITEGFKDALKRKNDVIGFVDADMATSPEAYYELVKNIGNHDGIIASRYVKGAVVNPKQSIQRIVASRIFNFLVRTMIFMNYRDTQCGAKLFKKNALLKIINNINITKWAFDVDLLYQLKKENMKIKEFPTVWTDREYSKINLKRSGPSMGMAIIRLRMLNSPLKDLIRVYDNLKLEFHLQK